METSEKDKKILGLQKNVFILGLTSLFNDFSSEMILSVFPAFFTSVLKSGAASLGLVEGLADTASNFIKIASGRISDKIQRRKIFAVLGYSLSSLTRPFYLLTSTVAGTLGLRVADRIGKGLRDAPRDALISLSIKKEEMGVSFGYHRAMDTIGGVLGPLCAYFILKKFPGGFNIIFLTAFAVGILAVFSLIFVKEVAKVIRDGDYKIARLCDFSFKFKMYILSVFILSAGSLPLAILLLRILDLNLSIALIPIYYMISNIASVIFSTWAGKMADKFGGSRIIISGYIFLILGYIVLGLANSMPALIFGFILIGIFSALTDGIQRSHTANLTSEEMRSSAYGFLNGVSGFGALVAGIFGGYTWQHFGNGIAFIAGGLLVVLGLAIFIITQSRLKRGKLFS